MTLKAEPVAWYHVPYPGNGVSPMVSLRQQHEPSMYGAVVPLYLAPPIMEPEIKVDKEAPVAWMLIEHEKYGNAVVVRKHKPKTYDSNWWTLTPLYTAPPPPQRKPLSGLEVERLLEQSIGSLPAARRLVSAIERAHGIGGEA